jgi:hypothetical protein
MLFVCAVAAAVPGLAVVLSSLVGVIRLIWCLLIGEVKVVAFLLLLLFLWLLLLGLVAIDIDIEVIVLSRHDVQDAATRRRQSAVIAGVSRSGPAKVNDALANRSIPEALVLGITLCSARHEV